MLVLFSCKPLPVVTASRPIGELNSSRAQMEEHNTYFLEEIGYWPKELQDLANFYLLVAEEHI